MSDERVLVLMPTARDGERTKAALEGAGLEAAVCADVRELCRQIATGAGAALLTEEAVVGSALQEALQSQPPWSDFPLVVLAREGAADRTLEIREAMNATLVERPVKIRSLLSVVRAALRARRHQYAVRDHLAERERQAEALRASEERLHVALRAGRMGTWDLDLTTRLLTCSASCKANYGRGPGESFTYEDLAAGVHEDDRERWRAAVADAVARSGEFEVEYRTLWPDGTTHWVYVRGNCSTGVAGPALSGVSLDVTERVLAEREARSGQERLRAALVAARMVAWEWTPADRKLRVSETAADVFGLPAGVGLTGIDQGLALVHPDDVAAYEAAYRDAIARRGSYHIYYRLVRPSDRRVIWIEERGDTVFDQPDGGVRLFGVAADVTERRRVEAEAVRLAERLRLALDAGELGTWEWNPATDEMITSDRASEMYGTTPGVPYAREVGRRLIHPDDRERAREAAERAVAKRTDYNIEYRLADRPVWVAAHGRGLYDAVGNLVRVHGVVQDVTARKIAEEELRTSEARFRTLFESMDQGFCVIEVTFESSRAVDYRFVELNPAFERHSGLSQNLLGKSIREAVPGLEEFWFDTYGRVAATGEPTRFVHYAAPLGRWFEVYAFRLQDPDWHRVAVLFTDVSDRKRAEEALRDQDRKKDDFIALLAHELRNPLAPIRNGLQVLRLGGTPDAATRARDVMDRQLTHMVRLIDDLLDVSRINRGKMELRRGRVELADVVGSAVEAARPAVDEAGHELSVTLPAAPVFLDADITRLSQVFSNLLTNSAKYTPKGGLIWLAAERTDGHAVVSVRDTGIGIPADSLATIFDMFSQVDRSVEKSTGGLGIGLALVKGLVEMHGGTVVAVSDGEGRGTAFTVTLPVAGKAEPAEPAPAAAPAFSPARRILVVDDNRDGAESMADMLGLLGHEIATAHDGLEAIACAESFRPDVILMDVGMPKLNGLDATRRIREQPWGKGIAIVALTGWGQDGDRERSKDAGCDAHLVKPVDTAALQRVLSEVAS